MKVFLMMKPSFRLCGMECMQYVLAREAGWDGGSQTMFKSSWPQAKKHVTKLKTQFNRSLALTYSLEYLTIPYDTYLCACAKNYPFWEGVISFNYCISAWLETKCLTWMYDSFWVGLKPLQKHNIMVGDQAVT